jgi:predicted DNA-binding protein (MmcQ/YjbR family)
MNIETLRDYCLSLPGATEDIKWEADLCFSVGGKIFCTTSIEPPHTVSFKVTDEQFGEMVIMPNIIPAPYLSRYKWVQVQNWDALNQQDWETYITSSYEMVKSKLPKSKLKLI